MRPGETLAVGYFLLMCGAALAVARRRRGWPRAFGWAALGVLVATTAQLAPAITLIGAGVTLRDWWLLAALPLAYWAPAPLVGQANDRLERWLIRVDGSLGLTRPRPSTFDPLELAYLLVYPMLPAGLAAVLASGGGVSPDMFWRAVLLAVLPCYGLLPLLPTRPPRAFLLPHTPSAGTSSTLVRRANVRFLATFGNTWNTLPSGHAAGAAAVALLVWRSGSPLAPAFALVAIGIALGTVRGRYHYAVDTMLGVALGILAGAIA